MWEISENLHRAELPQLERDKLIAEWCRLVGKGEVSFQHETKPQGGAGWWGRNCRWPKLGHLDRSMRNVEA